MSRTATFSLAGCNLGRWAFLEHAFGMLGRDGEDLREVQAKGLAPDTAKRIARDYGVLRTIHRVKDSEHKGGTTGGLPLLLKLMECRLHDRPRTLVEKAKICSDIAEAHKNMQPKRKKTNGQDARVAPFSAVTKLAWFREPDGWTMYDELARLGLSRSCKDVEFYQTLAKEGFQAKLDELSRELRKLRLKHLYPGRIVDKFLMFRGSIAKSEGIEGSYFDEARKRCIHRLKNLRELGEAGSKLADRLDQAADKIEMQLPDLAFPTKWVIKKFATGE